MGRLERRRALVTGGGSGIGAAVVRELAAQGASVAIHYRSSREGAEQLVREIRAGGGNAASVQGDLTVEADAIRVVADAVKHLGGLDILVNNAGDLVSRMQTEKHELGHFRAVTAVNVDSLMMVTREAIRHLTQALGGSSIINLSSLAGRKGGAAGSLAYTAAKGAVLSMTRMLSVELAPFGIRVNAVAPGFIEGTKFHATHTTREAAKKAVESIPLGRSGTPEDVARAIAFLASEYDGFITGATLDINGGVYCA